MSFVPTLQILFALKAELESLPLPEGAPGEKLFERVDFHENKKLREALADLLIVKQRVCIVVPGGDSYENFKEGRTVRSVCTQTFDLLIADRAWARGGHDAVFGGPSNLGVLAMKDAVRDHFVAHPQLGLPHVVLTPQEGAHIEIADSDAKDSPGRECFVLHYSTPAG
ncbi:MAG: hypothetical protein HZC55_26625, partial [Verrucomicrobia bacterium]|nr:hypothetical protein [Verrucomicrobiota bacterium]